MLVMTTTTRLKSMPRGKMRRKRQKKRRLADQMKLFMSARQLPSLMPARRNKLKHMKN